MNKYSFDAVIFDLDGVITQTALVHAQAWKAVFDDYLRQRAKEKGEPFVEFTQSGDYLTYVDGKPRYKGVESFLKSRKIKIPFGDPSDLPEKETICGIGNRKNIAFNKELDKNGVKPYESTVELIKDLQKAGIKLGVASSSKNCRRVLETAKLMHYFETRVDGEVSAELGLKGKPNPDIFTTACDNLGVSYDRAVVVEDADSGVKAGRNGNFGLTIGLARDNNHSSLRENGADIVLGDLAEIDGINTIEEWFKKGLQEELWTLRYVGYDPSKERSREALLATGNGYFGTRGAMEEVGDTKTNYPGTYMAGLYNRLVSKVGDKEIENEDFVNAPNWLPITFKIDEGEWFDPNNTSLLEIERNLNLKTGELRRTMVVCDNNGRETLIESKRIASMANQHRAAISYSVTPLNYKGFIRIKSELSVPTKNDGVERYSDLNQKHLKPIKQGGSGNTSYVLANTTQSGIAVSQAAKLDLYYNNKPLSTDFVIKESDGLVSTYVKAAVAPNETLRVEKLVSIYKSSSSPHSEVLNFVLNDVKKIESFKSTLESSALAWEKIWHKADIQISGDRFSQQLIRLHIYHTFVTTSPHNQSIDFGIPPRGLHGEAYRGHIFWDELYVLPFHCIHNPEIARAVLMYRYKRLDKAREYAKEHGYQGAMFPWQSGSDGREETQVVHLNPVSGEWGSDFSALQRHISIAVAYNVWTYYHITRDVEFINGYGAEIFFEICRFWASKAKLNQQTNRYEIGEVMGPDEFHEKLPGSKKGGLKDNAYTNIMVVWLMERASELIDRMDRNHRKILFQKINLKPSELNLWADIAQKINLVISPEGIISQFDGYLDLKELDWEAYRKEYKDIHRMDRILKAEGKSPDDYKVSKQADLLMTFYNLEAKEVTSIVTKLGYKLPSGYLIKNFNYYINRCSHGSTLSRVVHSYLGLQLGMKELGWELYTDALTSDLVDIQGGTTAEGIHMGVMTGTALMAITSFAGVNFHESTLSITPQLPNRWRSIAFNCTFRGVEYIIEVNNNSIVVTVNTPKGEQATILVDGITHTIDPYKPVSIPY